MALERRVLRLSVGTNRGDIAPGPGVAARGEEKHGDNDRSADKPWLAKGVFEERVVEGVFRVLAAFHRRRADACDFGAEAFLELAG